MHAKRPRVVTRSSSSPHRLLIIGSSAPEALESYYARSFSELGVGATVFNPEAVLAPVRKNRFVSRATWSLQHLVASRELERFFDREQRYDAIVVFKGFFLTPDAIARCRARSGARWLNLNPDNPFDGGRATSNERVRRAIPLYDSYLIWSKQLVPRIKDVGAKRVAYLPFAYEPSNHFPAPQLDASLANKVTFVGSYDAQRADTLDALADLPIQIYGPAWSKLRRDSPLHEKVVNRGLFDADLRRAVGSSLASINILRPQNEGAHNMRTFEVPAMGGLLLTSRSREQNEFFPEGEASLMFSDKAELRRRVEELLAGKHDIAALKRRGLELSAAHSYKQRAKSILELLREL